MHAWASQDSVANDRSGFIVRRGRRGAHINCMIELVRAGCGAAYSYAGNMCKMGLASALSNRLTDQVQM